MKLLTWLKLKFVAYYLLSNCFTLYFLLLYILLFHVVVVLRLPRFWTTPTCVDDSFLGVVNLTCSCMAGTLSYNVTVFSCYPKL